MSEKRGTITQVCKQGGRKRKLGPVIVHFEHGQVNPDAFEDFRAGLTYDFPDEQKDISKISSEPKLEVYVKSKHLTYSNEAPAAKDIKPNPYTRTLLAIRDRETNQVRLVETNTVVVAGEVTFPTTSNPFLVELRDKSEVEENPTTDQTQEQRTVLKKHLVREFGQAKGRRLAEQAERQKVDTAQKHEKLKSVAENVDASAILLHKQETPTELTPPCNRTTKMVESVYSLSDLLTDEELDSLESVAEGLYAEWGTQEQIEEAVKGKRITEVFGGILIRQLKLGDNRIAGAAIYLEAIFQYLKLSSFQVVKGAKALPQYMPYFIRQKVFDTFVPNMVVSEVNNDRAFCHALVLIFLLNNFSVQMKTLSASVRMKADRMKKLILVTGASLVTDSLTQMSFVNLKLPLTKFDPSKKMGKSKKKD